MQETKPLEAIKMADYFKLDDLSVNQLNGLVKMAEDAERYEDMAMCVNKLVNKRLDTCKDGEEVLNSDQRNHFSVAYKNVVGAKRQALRALDTMEKGDDDADSEEEKMYIAGIAQELFTWCKEILCTLEKLVVKATKFQATFNKDEADEVKKKAKTEADEALVFYDKMIGDYYRYLTEEFKKQDAKGKVDEAKAKYAGQLKKKCADAYQAALTVAEENLNATNATRLGLALNFSVAYFEILEEKDKAIKLAQNAFDAAIEKLDNLQDAGYKDSTLIMQLLRDNLTIWQNNDADAAEG